MPRTLRLAVLLLLPGAAWALEVRPGAWEISGTVVLPGAAKPTALVQTLCISEEEARDPTRLVGPRAGCRFSDRNDAGGVFTFRVACGGQLPLAGRGAVRYGPRSFEGDLDLVADAGGGIQLPMPSRISGRHMGACEK